jgi:hypothetical protein
MAQDPDVPGRTAVELFFEYQQIWARMMAHSRLVDHPVVHDKVIYYSRLLRADGRQGLSERPRRWH